MVIKIKNKRKTKVINESQTAKNKNVINVKVNIGNQKRRATSRKTKKEPEPLKPVIQQPYVLPSPYTTGGLIARQPEKKKEEEKNKTATTGLNNTSKEIPKREKNKVVDVSLDRMRRKDVRTLDEYTDNIPNFNGGDIYILKGKAFSTEEEAQRHADRYGITKDIKRIIVPVVNSPPSPKYSLSSGSSYSPNLRPTPSTTTPSLSRQTSTYAPSLTGNEPEPEQEPVEPVEVNEPVEPQPEPEPAPEPVQEPVPEPEPVQEPVPEPEPVQEPVPEPEPVQEPEPEPEVEPELEPIPKKLSQRNLSKDEVKETIINFAKKRNIYDDEIYYFTYDKDNNLFMTSKEEKARKSAKEYQDKHYYFIGGSVLNDLLENELNKEFETNVLNTKSVDEPGPSNKGITDEKLEEAKGTTKTREEVAKGAKADESFIDQGWEGGNTTIQESVAETEVKAGKRYTFSCPIPDCNYGENGTPFQKSSTKRGKAYKSVLTHILVHKDETARNTLKDQYKAQLEDEPPKEPGKRGRPKKQTQLETLPEGLEEEPPKKSTDKIVVVDDPQQQKTKSKSKKKRGKKK
jgi:hypothetical protein